MSFTKRARIELLRESIKKVTRLLTESRMPVYTVGSKAMVEYADDGKPRAVYLPELPENASDTLIDAMQGFVDHEVGHVLFSDFEVLLEGKQMNLALLLNAVEDTFIERAIGKLYRGTQVNVARMRDLFIDKFIEPEVEKARKAGVTDFKDWWGILGVCAIRAWSGQTEFKLYMDDKWRLLGNIPKAAEAKKIPERVQAITCSRDSLKVAIRLSHIVKDAEEMPDEDEKMPEDSDELDDPDKPEDPKISDKPGEPEDSDKPGDPKISDEPGDPEDSDKPGEPEDPEGDDSGEPGDPDSDDTEDSKGTEGSNPEDSDSGDAEGDDPNRDDAKGQLDDSDLPDKPPEGFDDNDFKGVESFLEEVISEEAKRATDASNYNAYTREADIIEPLADGACDSRDLEAMEEAIKRHIAPIQRQLASAFESKNRTFRVHGKRQGRLSGPSLHRLLTGDDRVRYQNKEQRTRQSAVQVVIDISGSMAGSGKIKLAGQVGWAIVEVLDRLKVSSEVICFTQLNTGESDHVVYKGIGGGLHLRSDFDRYGPIYMPILKSWEEQHFTPQHKRNFTRMANRKLRMSGNVDGESIQYAALRLAKRPEPGKIMIVLSDGQPAGDTMSHGLSAHLKEVVKDVARSGINIVGIGIKDASVCHYYPKNAVVSNLDELPSTVIGQLRRELLKD